MTLGLLVSFMSVSLRQRVSADTLSLAASNVRKAGFLRKKTKPDKEGQSL